MPELPEVETVRRGLAPAFAYARIERAELRRPDLRFPLPEGFSAALEGRKCVSLERRAKFLLLGVEGAGDVLMHLGMTGRFSVDRGQGAPGSGMSGSDAPGAFHYAQPGDPAHDHVIFHLRGADGARLRVVYNDPRRFGYMDLIPVGARAESRHLAALGPEPLSEAFNAETLSQALAGKKTPIKSALLDQQVVAGLGNIYVCEALFRAGISPRRRADTVAGARAERLAPAVKAVLSEAIEAGGSTLRDYAGADGRPGYFQHNFTVYGREGAACVTCGATVRRIVQSGRSTFYCGTCQR